MANLGEIAVTALSGLGQLVGIRSGTEEPRFSIVEHVGSVEIRHYGPRIAAEALVSGAAEQARNEGFRKVAGYIFGGNTTKASIAMTAPVVQSRGSSEAIAMTEPVVQTADGSGNWRVQFIMPAKYTLATLPLPNDPSVKIVQLPPQDYAVLRFTGSRSGVAVEAKSAELRGALQGNHWKVSGTPVAWFYDPPWTPSPLRRNEVALVVTRRP